MSFYKDGLGDVSIRAPLLQQGDIIARVPFFDPPARHLTVLDPVAKSVSQVDLSSETTLTRGQSIVEFRVSSAVVVTQTCDLERKLKPVVLAPALSYQAFYPNTDLNSHNFKSKWAEIENPGKMPTAFPLPPLTQDGFSMPCSIVDFTRLQSFEAGAIDSIVQTVVAGLSPAALAKFQERLSFCFGRLRRHLGSFPSRRIGG